MTQYNEAAASYASLVAPRYEAIAALLPSCIGDLDPHTAVVEIAAGTGVLTALMAERIISGGGCWVAGDVSSAMLRIARRNVDPAVHLVLASADHLPHPPSSVDLVISSLGPVQESVERFAEARRVLRPGGRLALTCWDVGYAEWDLLRTARERFDAPPMPATPTADAVARAEASGFLDLRAEVVTLDCVHDSLDAYLAYRRSFGRPPFVDPRRTDEWFASVREATLPYVDATGRVVLDWRIAVLTARAA